MWGRRFTSVKARPNAMQMRGPDHPLGQGVTGMTPDGPDPPAPMPPTRKVRSPVLTGSRLSRSRRFAAAATPLIVLALVVGGCSGDDSSDEGGGAGGGTGGSSEPPLATTAKVSEVTGKLSKHRRHAVVEQVAAVVDGWWDAAYLAPGGDKDPFPGFTAGAAELAQRDRAIMTAAAYPDGAQDPVAVRRSVAVDILAVHGRAAGVTASVALGVHTSGDTERVVAVRGLLELSRVDGKWRIFGYRVTATPRVAGAHGSGKHPGKQSGKPSGKGSDKPADRKDRS